MKSLFFTCLALFLFTTAAQAQLVNHFEEVEVILRQNKQVMPLSLPAGTTSYFYAITVLPNKKKRPAQESLYSQLLRNTDKPMEQMANRVSLPSKRNGSVNVILVKGKANAKNMKEGAQFDYEEYFVNQPSGATYMSTGSMEDLYIGIENRRIPKTYRVLVEVVAVVE